MTTEELLDRSETLTEILKVIHSIEDDKNYTKQDAANDLMKFLKLKGYL